MNRVFITGMSIVSPIGTGAEEFFSGIDEKRQGIDAITCFDTKNYPVSLGGEARKNGKILSSEPDADRRILINDFAFDELLKNDPLAHYSPEERMIIVGSGVDFFKLKEYAESSDSKTHDWHSYSNNSCSIYNACAASMKCEGGTIVNVAACVASTQAMGLSFRVLQQSQKKIIISGGCDSMLNPMHYMGFYKLGALSDWKGDPRKGCRPYDRDRCGVVLGEGAAYYIMENSVGIGSKNPLAEIAGYSSTVDAYLVTDPEPEGTHLSRAALEAIRDAGITPDDIDCVHAHGTGTRKNDTAECSAMKKIFGSRYRDVPVFSLKGQVGHLIGACGAIETAAVIYSLQNQVVPATVNFETADPDIDLNVLKKPLKKKIEYILKLNAAFGGQNAALVFKRCG
jgi:3-oxoacyl-[acyl-carrier-protein] synthase II